LWVTVALLAACGGGGGGDGGGGNPPAARPTVSGQVSVLDGNGRLVAAGAGRSVELVVLGTQGEPGAVLATTSTDAKGQYTFTLPEGRSNGPALGLSTSDGAGGRYRAIALGADAPLGPASEAVTREIFAALGSGGGAVEAHARLTDFYRNTTLWLSLLDPGSAAPSGAISRLRETLLADAAVRVALDELALRRRLVANLGDIGGLLGFTARVIELDDSEEGLRTLDAGPSADTAGEWLVEDSAAGSTATPDRVWLRLEDDGVLRLRSQLQQTGSANVLLGLIGPHKVQTMRWQPGVEQTLTDVRRATDGYDFGGDRLPDVLAYTLKQRMLGVEALEVMGEPRRALVFEITSVLRIELSEGGQLVVQGVERRWHVPALGVVRSVENNQSIDRGGRVTDGSVTRAARRAVAADTSWPGGVRFTATPLSTPRSYLSPMSLGLTVAEQLVATGAVPDVCCVGQLGISVRPLGAAGGSFADILVPPGLLGPRAFLSPDGRRIYVATSALMSGDGTNVARDPQEAAAQGALIVRYDATTLQEEARMTLPPVPSRLQPGLAFSRYLARTIVISPTDSTLFAVAGVDAVLVRGTTVLSSLGSGDLVPITERLEGDGRARLLSDQIVLRGWDAERQELRLEINGGGAFSRAVPVSAQGLDTGAMRNSVPVLYSLWQSGGSEGRYDHVDRQRLYLDGFRIVVHPDTGAAIASLAQQPDVWLRQARCAQRAGQVACIDGSRIHLLDADLRPQRTVALQSDLRRRLGGPMPGVPDGALHTAADGSLVYVTESVYGLTAYRLRFD